MNFRDDGCPEFFVGHAKSKKHAKLYWVAPCLVGLILLAAVAGGPIMSNVEQPKYKTLSSEGSIEVREYEPLVAAEIAVKGERSAAIREGFRTIAAYIFGANKPNSKIAMTAPVTQQSNGHDWTVRFIMPARWTIETLPEPNDPRVKLVPIPARRVVVIRISGFVTDRLIAAKTAELRGFASQLKLDAVGEPILAFYNPPWTLPFLRRNEVMLEVAPK